MRKRQSLCLSVGRSGRPRSPWFRLVRLTTREIKWTRHGDDLEEAIVTLSRESKELLKKPDRSPAETDRLEALFGLLDEAKRDRDAWLDALADSLRAERPSA